MIALVCRSPIPRFASLSLARARMSARCSASTHTRDTRCAPPPSATHTPKDDEDDDTPLLRRAIQKHREMNESFGIDPTQIDEALWSSLAGAWKFADIDTKRLSEELDD